jgi:hypothetical protein
MPNIRIKRLIPCALVGLGVWRVGLEPAQACIHEQYSGSKGQPGKWTWGAGQTYSGCNPKRGCEEN